MNEVSEPRLDEGSPEVDEDIDLMNVPLFSLNHLIDFAENLEPEVVYGGELQVLEQDYTRLSTFAHKVIDDVLTVAVAVAAALTIASTVLPAVHFPAGDIVTITVVSAAITALVKALGRFGFKPNG